MEKRAGAFIVIEGSDGSGKSTQLKLIQERLAAAGYDVATFDFPQYDQPSSYFIRRYLDGAYGGPDDVGPYTGSLFYALDRFEAAPKIRQALSQGKIVVVDRYTGSNMAHQGAKIANAEQRRGFFIWLDNLEFEMLRVPRPDISFILRVPAEISQHLMASREKQDIHEADMTHLERAVVVYDDMAQLFPKDFQRVDCVRNGQLLDIQTVHTMLWEKISPLLPPPSAQPRPTQAAVSEPIATEAKKAPSEQAPAQQLLTIENASGLLAQKIERLAVTAKLEYPEIPAIHMPSNLIPNAQKEYEAKAHTMLGLHAKLVAGLIKKGMKTEEAKQAALPALMVAATATAYISPDDPGLETLITRLINDNMLEAQAAGAQLLAQTIKINPDRFKKADKPIKQKGSETVQALAEEFLASNHIGERPPVELTAVWPRNEIDLVADMLYEHTNLPLRTIQERIATWPMARKLDVFDAYIGDGQPGSVLEKVHYSWDLLTPYGVFRELQQYSSEALQIQQLTPRYGYDIPKAIEDAGLSDTYEKCFDVSLELYSILQQAGHHNEAQYATLFGHNQRWQFNLNAVQIAATQEHVANDVKNVVRQMQEKIAEIHPILSETISASDKLLTKQNL